MPESTTTLPTRLLLASASPRRAELLAAAGFAVDVEAVDVDERRHDAEPPRHYVERLARLKASVAAAHHPGRIVVAADTAVVVDDRVLGKPRDEADARRMLALLSGRSHEVLTGLAIAAAGTLRSHVERTTVWFRVMSEAEIRWYAGSGEPGDKAGGYAIQGLASRFIPRIEGSYTNVVGLPVAAVSDLLAETGGVSGAAVASPAAGPYPDR